MEVRSEEGTGRGNVNVTGNVSRSPTKQRIRSSGRSGSASAPIPDSSNATSLGGHDHDHDQLLHACTDPSCTCARALSERGRTYTQPSAPLKSRPGFLGAARQRARAALAPLLSIRSLFVLSAALQVVGAVVVVFCIMWYMTQRSVDELVTTLIRNLQRRANEIVEAYLTAATVVADDIARDVESGILSRRSWRTLLEQLDHGLDNFPSIALDGVRYTEGYSVSVESCNTDEPDGLCAMGRRASFGNATHMMVYEMGRQGQPTRHLFTSAAGVAGTAICMSWLKEAVASGAGSMSSWIDVHYLFVSSPAGAVPVRLADPLDGMVVSYFSTFNERPSLDARLPSGGDLPGTPGGTPASEPATPPEFFATSTSGLVPIAGMVGVNIRLGDLSRRLLDAVQFASTLMIITTAQGRMVATSTRESAHVVDARMEPIPASKSPDALTRDLVRLFAGGAHADEAVVVFQSGGGRYFGSRVVIRLEPNLDLFLYTAVSRDGVLTDLVRARNIALGVCGAWLLLTVVAAGVASWLITRPIEKVRVAMSLLLDTMSRVYLELRMHVDPQRTRAEGPPRSGGGGPTLSPPSSAASLPSSSSPLPLHGGIRELTAFDRLVADMHSRFVAFQQIVSAEAKLKMEMEVRSEETRKFLATVSHEMRTPLNGILGMLDLARECTLPPNAADYIESAAISGEHLLLLVNDILDLQKMEAGLVELSSVPVDVRAAVMAAVRIVKRKADEKGLQVGIDVAEDVPLQLVADPDRLRQVLLNLLSNAVKYTKSTGAVEVRVDMRERPRSPTASDGPRGPRPDRPDRCVLRFEVQDTGPGISAEHQRSLFQRFFRVHHISGPEVDPGGTGLGLAISREIVEKAGGRIGCTSAEGQGSIFWFELPCGRVPPDASLPPSGGPEVGVTPFTIVHARGSIVSAAGGVASLLAIDAAIGSRSPKPRDAAPASGSPKAPSSGGDVEGGGPPLRVLVAEDNAMSAKVITSMLQRGGHAVTLAANGDEAARAFEGALAAAAPGAPAFDIVFMDCVMPVCDGFEATARIRRLEAARGAPRHLIVALTAKAGSEDEAACRAAGMDAFLSKPVRRATLAPFVGGYLRTPTGSTVASPQLRPLPRQSSSLSEPGEAPRGPAAGSPGLVASSPWGALLEPLGPRRPPPAPAGFEAAPMPPLALAPVQRTPELEPAKASVEPGDPRRGGTPEPPARTAPRRYSRGALGLSDRGIPREERGIPREDRRISREERGIPREERLALEALAAGPESLSPAKPPKVPPKAPASDPPAGPPLDILVVDDVEMNRRVLRMLLQKEGHTVSVACDGQEAAEAFERRVREAASNPGRPCFDLIFMDVSMPVMDGYASTRRIRHAEEGLRGVPRTPVVACTALNSSKDREEMGAAGMDDLVVKPVGRPIVRAILAKWARGGRQDADGPSPKVGGAGGGGGGGGGGA